eukprot:PhF_6_TR38132/c0_g1_i1/m.56932
MSQIILQTFNAPYTRIVDPYDNYLTQCRKYMFSCMLLLSPLNLIAAVTFVADGMSSSEKFSIAQCVGLFAMLWIAIPLGVMPWCMIYFTRHWSERAMDTWLFFLNFAANVLMVSYKAKKFHQCLLYLWFLERDLPTKTLFLTFSTYHDWFYCV